MPADGWKWHFADYFGRALKRLLQRVKQSSEIQLPFFAK